MVFFHQINFGKEAPKVDSHSYFNPYAITRNREKPWFWTGNSPVLDANHKNCVQNCIRNITISGVNAMLLVVKNNLTSE